MVYKDVLMKLKKRAAREVMEHYSEWKMYLLETGRLGNMKEHDYKTMLFSLIRENDELLLENIRLKRDGVYVEGKTDKLQAHRLAVKNGEIKIAYKKSVTPEKVYELVNKYYDRNRVADILDVSLSTINRRLKEYKDKHNK